MPDHLGDTVQQHDVRVAAATAAGNTAEARLVAWLRRFFNYVTSKRPVAIELLEHVERTEPLFETVGDRVLSTSASILPAAQKTGEVTAAITLAHILDLIVALAKTPCDSGYREAILNTLAGLRLCDVEDSPDARAFRRRTRREHCRLTPDPG